MEHIARDWREGGGVGCGGGGQEAEIVLVDAVEVAGREVEEADVVVVEVCAGCGGGGGGGGEAEEAEEAEVVEVVEVAEAGRPKRREERVKICAAAITSF